MKTHKTYNKFNQFYVDHFEIYLKDSKSKNNSIMTRIYLKLIASIQKYPFPILSPPQALSLDKIGPKTSNLFEKMISEYKIKIKKENIDYIALGMELDHKFDTKESRKLERSKSKEPQKFDSSKRKKLINIEQNSSSWTCAISCYILYFQNNYDQTIDYDDILAMTTTLKEHLAAVYKYLN